MHVLDKSDTQYRILHTCGLYNPSQTVLRWA